MDNAKVTPAPGAHTPGLALNLRLVTGFSDGDTVSMTLDVLGYSSKSHREVFDDICCAVNCHAELLAALEGHVAMFEKVSKCVQWGKTFLNAEAIAAMNEASLAASAALRAAGAR